MTPFKQKAQTFGESFKEGWSALVTLVRMQLKEKMDMSYLRSTRKFIFKVTWLLIEFAAITALLYLALYYIKLLRLFSMIQDVPVSVISLVFTVMLALSLISDTAGLMKALYFSRDNTVLLTFPATPSLVFFSKLAVFYLYEFRKNFMFTIPLFLAYGMVKGYGFLYYPWLFFMFVLISVVPVLLAALLSIPSMYVYVFLNRTRILQYILFVGVTAAGIFLLWELIGMIPEDINFVETWGDTFYQIQDFLKAYTKTFAPIYAFTELIVGKTVGLTNVVFHSNTLPHLLILIGIAAVLLILCFLLSKPLFYRMASTPFEFKKKESKKPKFNKERKPFISALKKEWMGALRSNSYIKLGGILVVLMPMVIALLNKIYSAMNTRYLGTQMTVCFNVYIILLILLLTNIDMASVYSRDGSSAYLNKVQPTPYPILLIAKLIFPMLIALCGVITTVTVFVSLSSLTMLDGVMLGITVYAIYIAHLFSSAESDIMNPQYEQYATFSEQSNNPNETHSGILAIIFSSLAFIVALFLSSGSASGVWTKLAIVTVVLAVAKVFTYLMKIKAFYKEK